MQGDGNLVVYDCNGTPVWASNTAGYNNGFVVVQSDGNTRIYKNPDGTYVWETGTGGR